VDKDALEAQAQEKRDREQAEADRDEAFARLTQYFADQLTLMQQEADQIRKAYNHDTEAFRQQQQLKHTRREWDINRPDAKQLDLPARVGDDDARLGPASLQKFDGEDLTVSGARSLCALRVARVTCPPRFARKRRAAAAGVRASVREPAALAERRAGLEIGTRDLGPAGGRPQEGSD
jgi:hypothetical protein